MKNMTKGQIIGLATVAIRASGVKLPWNAASWGPTGGRPNSVVVLDEEATKLARRFPSWMRQLAERRFMRLRQVIQSASADGMNSPLTKINIWDLVEKFPTPVEATTLLAKLENASRRLLEPNGLNPMRSALGANLLRVDESAPEEYGRSLEAIAKQVAEATVSQVVKKNTPPSIPEQISGINFSEISGEPYETAEKTVDEAHCSYSYGQYLASDGEIVYDHEHSVVTKKRSSPNSHACDEVRTPAMVSGYTWILLIHYGFVGSSSTREIRQELLLAPGADREKVAQDMEAVRRCSSRGYSAEFWKKYGA